MVLVSTSSPLHDNLPLDGRLLQWRTTDVGQGNHVMASSLQVSTYLRLPLAQP